MRSFLFLFFGGIFLIVHPLRADVPPAPRQHTNNVQLNALANLTSGSRVTHPQANPAGTSIQTTQHVERIPEPLSPPSTIRQTNFAPQRIPPLSDRSNEPQQERLPEEMCDEEYELHVQRMVDAHNATLDRPLSSGRLPMPTRNEYDYDYDDDESDTGGWMSGIAKPNASPLLSIAGSLLIVLGAFFLLAIFLRKVSPQGSQALPKEAFECLGRYFLTQKHQLQVLRLGNRIVLISVMQDNVSTLAEITDPDEAVAFLGLCRRLDSNSATEAFRKTVASMSEEELRYPQGRPVATRQRERASSLDLYSDPDESLASILARGRR